MAHQDEYFIRRFELEVIDVTLELHQKLIGSVGCVVWDAAILLAKYLEKLYEKNNLIFKNLNAIELGCGIGCVGMTAACLGANVLLTDLPEMLPLLQKNIEINQTKLKVNNGTVKASSLTWGLNTRVNDPPHLILLADCIYYVESIQSLVTTLKTLATSFTKILISQEMRDSYFQKQCWDYFSKLIQLDFEVKTVPLDEQHEVFRSPTITLLELTPK